MEDKKEKNKNDNEEKFILKIFFIFIILLLIVVVALLWFRDSNNEERFTVNFNSAGGSLVKELVVIKDGKINKPKDPLREGYIFNGWFVGDEEFNFDSKITSDMTLEANWILIEEINNSYNLDLN